MPRKEIIGIVALALFFIAGALLSQRFSDEIIRYLDFGAAGMVAYVSAGIIATVIAPVSTLPIVPVAVALWGPLVTALLSIFSWSTGSLAAFLVARRYGRPIAGKFVDLKKAESYETALSERGLFWNVLFLRMAVPVDVLSYAVGLFSSMKTAPYMLATVLGIAPFAFIFAYASEASLPFQVITAVLVLTALFFGYRKIKKTRQK